VRPDKRFDHADATVVTALGDLADQHRGRDPIRKRLRNPLDQIRFEWVQLARTRSSFSLRSRAAQIPPHCIARNPHRLRQLPNRLAALCPDSHLHHFLLVKHRGPKSRDQYSRWVSFTLPSGSICNCR
jgi:hypothetical protein